MADDEGRKCIVCQKPLHKGSKFCSKKCEGIYRRKVARVVCLNCGKEFEVINCKRGERKFCSHQCYWEYKKKQVKVVCQYCGKEFSVYEARVKRGAKFCSKECEMLYRWGDGRKIESECLWCGKKFVVFLSEVEKGNGKFCSKECYDQYRRSEDYKQDLSMKIKEKWQDLEFRERVEAALRNEEQKKKVSAKLKAKWQDLEFRERMMRIFSSEEYKRKISEKSKALWNDPEFRKEMLLRIRNDEFRQKISEKCKLYWQDLSYREKVIRGVMNARKVRPNGLEKNFCELLQGYFLGEWRYVGDGKVFIAGFVPDFIHREEDWIIELNGNYWHGFPDVQERDKRKKEAYEKAGYKVLEIWEGDFKSDPIGVVKKIMEYFYGES